MSSAIGLLVMLKQAPICFVMFKQAPIFCSSCSNRLPFSVRHVQTVQTGLCSCCRLRRTSRLSGCGPARTRRSPSSTRTWTSCPQTRCSFLSSVSPAGCEQCSVNNALMRDFGLSTRLSCGTLACPQDCHAGLWPVHKTVMQDFLAMQGSDIDLRMWTWWNFYLLACQLVATGGDSLLIKKKRKKKSLSLVKYFLFVICRGFIKWIYFIFVFVVAVYGWLAGSVVGCMVWFSYFVFRSSLLACCCSYSFLRTFLSVSFFWWRCHL